MKVFRKTNPQSTARRERVITRLENQLLAGKKTVKNAKDYFRKNGKNALEDLTDVDIKRIKKELSTLKVRV